MRHLPEVYLSQKHEFCPVVFCRRIFHSILPVRKSAKLAVCQEQRFVLINYVSNNLYGCYGSLFLYLIKNQPCLLVCVKTLFFVIIFFVVIVVKITIEQIRAVFQLLIIFCILIFHIYKINVSSQSWKLRQRYKKMTNLLLVRQKHSGNNQYRAYDEVHGYILAKHHPRKDDGCNGIEIDVVCGSHRAEFLYNPVPDEEA